MDLQVILLLIAGLLVTVALSQPLADRIGLSPSVLLALVGIAIGLASMLLMRGQGALGFATVATVIVNLPFHSEAFLYIFLPMLVFDAGLNIEVRRMVEDAAPILMLAVVAVVVATVLIGAALMRPAPVPAVACFMLASMVATTDPVAVIAIFRDVGAPSRLSRLVEGESLLNDAAAITIFVMLLDSMTSGRQLSLATAAVSFVRSFAGGIAIGYVGARVVVGVLRRLLDMRLPQVTLTLALPYIVYIVAERHLGVSGVMATLTAGLVMSATAQRRMSPDDWHFLRELWEQLAFWGSSLVFLLASLLVPRMLLNAGPHDAMLLAVLIGAAFVARMIVVFGLLPLMTWLRLSPEVDNRFKAVILWGGLRGALTLVLALSITENPAIAPDVQRFIAILATGFVLFTLLVNGTTLRVLIRLLGLDRLTPVDQALRNQVLKLSRDRVSDTVKMIGVGYEFPDEIILDVLGRRSAAEAETPADTTSSVGLADAGDQVLLGLAALGGHERELVLHHFAERTMSGRVLEEMLAFAGRLIDKVRVGDPAEYLHAAREMVEFSRRFRFAHWVHRYFHIDGPLVDCLADRYESLLVQQIVLKELAGYLEEKLAPLLGPKVASILRNALGSRRDMTGAALEALRAQYPSYAEDLERRILNKVWLRREDVEYRALFEDGIIGPELYSAMRREVQVARNEVEVRPRLDLGLETRQLIARVPMFARLNRAQLDTIARTLRSRFAVPGERLIRDGDRADAMYFISSGSVEVDVAKQKIRLNPGDFFGEMGLVTGQPRQGNVYASGYCQLLVLKEEDFQNLVRSDAEIQRQIASVASARGLMNERAGAGRSE
ncbi:MAG TPA: cation:proton antiporter [Candidatus Binataceae bacterium]|nr:cation:proton antiporter [Candidatus Binataceae bacterium]